MPHRFQVLLPTALALAWLGLGGAGAAAGDRADDDAADAEEAAPEPAKVRGPARCTLSWTGPDEVCTLPGGWIGDGAGRSQNAAAKAARSHLDQMVRTATDIAVQRTEGSMAILASLEAQAACPAHVMDTAVLSCKSAPGVVEERLCFADIPEEPWREHEGECPAPEMITLEGWGSRWRHRAGSRSARAWSTSSSLAVPVCCIARPATPPACATPGCAAPSGACGRGGTARVCLRGSTTASCKLRCVSLGKIEEGIRVGEG